MLAPDSNLTAALAQRGYNRRQLIKFCGSMLGILALPQRYLAQTVAAVSKYIDLWHDAGDWWH